MILFRRVDELLRAHHDADSSLLGQRAIVEVSGSRSQCIEGGAGELRRVFAERFAGEERLYVMTVERAPPLASCVPPDTVIEPHHTLWDPVDYSLSWPPRPLVLEFAEVRGCDVDTERFLPGGHAFAPRTGLVLTGDMLYGG